MKRVHYVLVDHRLSILARMTLPEGEPVELDPWMIHGIQHRGWSLKSGDPEESGVTAHGWADWQGVADNLAAVLRPMLDDSVSLSEEEAEQLLKQAEAALDDYRVAHMEVSVATVGPGQNEEGEDDGGTE